MVEYSLAEAYSDVTELKIKVDKQQEQYVNLLGRQIKLETYMKIIGAAVWLLVPISLTTVVALLFKL